MTQLLRDLNSYIIENYNAIFESNENPLEYEDFSEFMKIVLPQLGFTLFNFSRIVDSNETKHYLCKTEYQNNIFYISYKYHNNIPKFSVENVNKKKKVAEKLSDYEVSRKMKVVSFTIPTELLNEIKPYIKKLGITRSEFIRSLIQEKISKNIE